MSHTQGRLRIGTQPPNGEQTIGTEQGLMVAVATTGIDMPTKDNARRLVAAWNACEGAPTEWLETNKPVAEIANEIRALRAVNAELVEALKKISAIELKEFGADWEEIEEAQDIADAALAKAAQAQTEMPK